MNHITTGHTPSNVEDAPTTSITAESVGGTSSIRKFKTNINCNGCINAVATHLDKAPGIRSWKVDTTDPDKILTIEAGGISTEDLKQIVERAGFNAEVLAG